MRVVDGMRGTRAPWEMSIYIYNNMYLYIYINLDEVFVVAYMHIGGIGVSGFFHKQSCKPEDLSDLEQHQADEPP